MIYSLYIIDILNPGIPLIEHEFSPIPSEGDRQETEILEEFFMHIENTIRKIQDENYEKGIAREFTRILVMDGFNVIFYHCGIGEFVVCSMNDLDDEKDKILECFQSISRRFHLKHGSSIQEYRYSGKTELFNSFKIDIVNLTLNGTIGEEYPKLIVNENTLKRLNNMAMINDSELKVANNCDGTKTPFKIARILHESYDIVKEALTKLKNLDIIEQKNLIALKKR